MGIDNVRSLELDIGEYLSGAVMELREEAGQRRLNILSFVTNRRQELDLKYRQL